MNPRALKHLGCGALERGEVEDGGVLEGGGTFEGVVAPADLLREGAGASEAVDGFAVVEVEGEAEVGGEGGREG